MVRLVPFSSISDFQKLSLPDKGECLLDPKIIEENFFSPFSPTSFFSFSFYMKTLIEKKNIYRLDD